MVRTSFAEKKQKKKKKRKKQKKQKKISIITNQYHIFSVYGFDHMSVVSDLRLTYMYKLVYDKSPRFQTGKATQYIGG
jgi:hypothetical protein